MDLAEHGRTLELFELEMIGGAFEKRYRKLRPEVETMPWGTLDPSRHPSAWVIAARKAWTGAAFQEFRTGAACAATLRALIEARAPLDLLAVACRFPLDEVVHVELCSRLATELGGGVEMAYDPTALIDDPGAGEEPLMRAAHLVVAYFCVGEALSIPLLHGTWKQATHPLVQAVLRCIVLDEADHGTFGWAFLDWAGPHLRDEDRQALGATADRYIGGIHETWAHLRAQRTSDQDQAHALGWLGTDEYLALAARSLASQVVAPLRARGIPVSER
jgi:hypothetical protein